MRQLNPYEVSWIKNQIHRHISGMKCPWCEAEVAIGAVTEDEQAPAIFCIKCQMRMSITLVLTQSPNPNMEVKRD